MKSLMCDQCGAGAQPGASVCAYCGTTFVTAVPGVPVAPAGVDPEVVKLLKAGNKIGAIKVYLDANRCGLLNAKNAVEAIERALQGRG